MKFLTLIILQDIMYKLFKAFLVFAGIVFLYIWAVQISLAFKTESDYRSQNVAIQRERDSLQVESLRLQLKLRTFIDSVRIR